MQDDLSDGQVHLLKQAKSWVHDGLELISTKVHRAVMLGCGVSEALEEEPWAIHQYDDKGYTPLQTAVLCGRVKVVEQLIAAQADVAQKDWHSKTALMHAASLGYTSCMHLLLTPNSNVDQQNDTGNTALNYAMWCGSSPAVALLLAAGASPMKRQKWGRTPLHYLAYSTTDQKAADEVVRLLLVKGVDLDAADTSRMTPALCALSYTNIPVLRSLVEAGASLHAIDENRQNMLHFAARFCNLKMLHYLNTLGLRYINTELCDNDGRTPRDSFCQLIQAPDWKLLVHERRPSSEEQDAFVYLYNSILLRNLQDEIKALGQLLQLVTQQDTAASRTALDILIKQKEDWGEPSLTAWYRGVKGLVLGNSWESAVAALEDMFVELQSKKRSLPRKLDLQGPSFAEQHLETSETKD